MYESITDLLTLKREALTANDITLLRDIRGYERNLTIYYKRRNEDVVRDRSGQIVELEMSLPEILVSLEAGSMATQEPGALLAKVRGKKAETLIIEVTANAEFPITAADLPALRSEHTQDPDRIAGVGFYQPCPGLYFVKVGDMTQEQLNEYLEFSESIFNQ